MTQKMSQDVFKLSLKEKLKKLGQPEYVYEALMKTDAKNQAYVEDMVNIILIKGYMTA